VAQAWSLAPAQETATAPSWPLSGSAIEKHVNAIVTKLDLGESPKWFGQILDMRLKSV